MDRWTRYRLLTGLVVLLRPESVGAQSTPDSLPPGVTPAMVAAGKKVFLGEGLCLACHGENGKGLVGPDLTDDTWLHRTGSYEDIIHQIKTGTDASQSKSGQIMPPLGGSGISETKVRAVAAYVWSLSRRPAKKT